DRLKLGAARAPRPAIAENFSGLVATEAGRPVEHAAAPCATKHPERIPSAVGAATPDLRVTVPPARARVARDVGQHVIDLEAADELKRRDARWILQSGDKRDEVAGV